MPKLFAEGLGSILNIHLPNSKNKGNNNIKLEAIGSVFLSMAMLNIQTQVCYTVYTWTFTMYINYRSVNNMKNLYLRCISRHQMILTAVWGWSLSVYILKRPTCAKWYDDNNPSHSAACGITVRVRPQVGLYSFRVYYHLALDVFIDIGMGNFNMMLTHTEISGSLYHNRNLLTVPQHTTYYLM